MSAYLSGQLVKQSFEALAPIVPDGKKHLERSSAILYFLSLLQVLKRRNKEYLDIDPETEAGLTDRKDMELSFERLVLLHAPPHAPIRQVYALGDVREGGAAPVKRISSNFFTVPVKKASGAVDERKYPNRPAPLLALGARLTGRAWGIKPYNGWQEELPKFFTEVKSKSPFTHLAIFVCRHMRDFSADCVESLNEQLTAALAKIFPFEFVKFMNIRMRLERRLFPGGAEYYVAEPENPFAGSVAMSEIGKHARRRQLNLLKKEELVNLILELETRVLSGGEKGFPCAGREGDQDDHG